MATRQPEKLGSMIGLLLKRFGLEKKLSELDAVRLWAEIVGESIAEKTEALRVVEGKLIVRVADPVWRQELVFLKSEFLRAINARLGRSVLKDIFFS